jgi:hypothetical protein
MPLQATSGAASYDAFGGGATSEVVNYIEDVFSTWLYTGNSAAGSINNNINLSGKGGLVWIKNRTSSGNHRLYDTLRGALNVIYSDLSSTQSVEPNTLTAFNSNGFTIGSDANINLTGQNYASWAFRRRQKFFDVVTYTGNSANRTISHNLGSVPGCMIIKRLTGTTSNWTVYHRSLTDFEFMSLNTTGAVAASPLMWNATRPTDTVFSLGQAAAVNFSGSTYVAYLFAHNAGGFGLNGTDNVISCGSYVGSAFPPGPLVSLGFEPQWLMIKNTSNTGNWQIIDTMRGMPVDLADSTLQANLSDAESSVNYVRPTSSGFQVTSTSSEVNTTFNTYIYIAIRRGPMKVPTTGTSVLGLNARTGTGSNATVTGGAGVTDMAIIRRRNSSGVNWVWVPRLTGTGYLSSDSSNAEVNAGATVLQANPWDVMDGVKVGSGAAITNASGGATYINYLLDRAPSFFDVVCYTGNGASNQVLNHNLGVAPEFVVSKGRSVVSNWIVGHSLTSTTLYGNILNSAGGQASFGPLLYTSNSWLLNAAPTATTITIAGGGSDDSNDSGVTYVAYLFATCPGVSKVGSYTGTGTTQQINCGFTAGARFVLIKRTDSTGDWYVWDSARGIVAGNDPYLLLNLTTSEVTSTDFVDTFSAGFEISSTAPAAINASGGNYIFLAIA